MSEHLRPTPEAPKHDIDTSKEIEHNLEKLREHAENSRNEHKEKLETIKHKVEHEAISGREITIGEQQESAHHTVHATKQLKNTAYRRTLNKIRSHLPKSEQTLSRIIHRPTIERFSSIGAQTIARPSGLLAGSLFAFLGSTLLLLLSRHYGFQYNYLVIFLLFIGGFGVGLIVETIGRLGNRKRSRHLR